MSFPRTLRTALPALALLFSMNALRAQQVQKQLLPEGCKSSIEEMSDFLKADDNQVPVNRVSGRADGVHVEVVLFANQAGADPATGKGEKGSWTLVNVALEDVIQGGNEPDIRKGTACVILDENSGYPDRVERSGWFQQIFATRRPTAAPAHGGP